MRRWPRLLLLVILLGVSATASAKTAPALKTTPIQALTVYVDRGLAVPLAEPAASVFIANPDVADVQVMSPTSLMVFGKKTGHTTLMATGNDGHTLIERTIAVMQYLSDLRAALRTIIPGNRIKVESVPDGIVLTGEAHDPTTVADAQRLAARYVTKDGAVINRIKISGSNQIHIRVRFAEVSRDVDKQFGIDWNSIGSVGGFAFGLASGAGVVAAGGSAAALLGNARPVTGTNTNDIIPFSAGGSKYNVNGMIDALAQNGFITILAEPNLTAMSGETASFLAGGEFPVPIPTGQGQVTIEWKQYGVSLAFTPTLIGTNRISLHVRPEVSELSPNGAITLNNISVPALTTRRAETTIELGSGQSFAMAGLLDNNQNQTVSKYPFLGDMPVLGALFRSTRFQNSQSELVIIITPYIVTPSDDRQLALPTDNFSQPSDADQLLKLRSSGTDPAAPVLSGKPVAVPVNDDVAPTPIAVPLSPVTSVGSDSGSIPAATLTTPPPTPAAEIPYAPPAPAATPVAIPAAPPEHQSPAPPPMSNPAGPGGFIME